MRLLTIAMMRPGDKVESYRRLAAGLRRLQIPFHLTIVGDGSAAEVVRAYFEAVSSSVTFLGAIDDRARLRSLMDEADLFVWPGVGEGVGMVFLEAQAAGLPVIAEDHPTAHELVRNTCVPADEPGAFAMEIVRLSDPDHRARAAEEARRHVLRHHSLASAADILRVTLASLLR
ncbi:MAG: glycosyltransferase family 4 protein [Pseudomonadota bacterium]